MIDKNIVSNSTYYSTDDIVQNIDHVLETVRKKLFGGNPPQTNNFSPVEIMIRFMTGAEKVSVFTEHVYSTSGSKWGGRMVIGIQRRNKLFDSDVERIAFLATPEQVLPQALTLQMLGGVCNLFIAYNSWDRVSRMITGSGVTLDQKHNLISTPIRIFDRSDADEKKGARVVMLRSKLARALTRKDYGTKDLEFLRNKVLRVEKMLESLDSRIEKMATELSKIDE